jgi:flagellar FliJ protein
MQSILDIKYKLEEQAKQQYMEVRHRYNTAVDELEHLRQRREGYFQEYRGLLNQQLDLLEIDNCKNAINIMEEYINNQIQVVKKIETELEQAVEHMNEAMKERKIYEKLREKQFEIFLQELNREEAKEIDELVSYQYNDAAAKED